MSDFNLLNEFIDGEITAEMESEFFAKLASNAELQTKLKQLLAFRASLQSNKELFVPTHQSTQAIYSAIGFKAAAVSDNLYQTDVKNKGGYSRRNYSILKWSLISSLITALIVYLLMMNYSIDGAGSKINPDIIINSKNNPLPGQNSKASQLIQQSKEGKAFQKESSALTKNSLALNQSFLPNAENNDTFTSWKINASAVQIENSGKNKLLTSGKNINADYLSSDTQHDYQPLSGNEPLLTADLPDLKFEFLGTQYWHTPEATISPSHIAKFNNNALGIYYNVNENFSAGIEIRVENFFQRFTGIDTMGVENIYEQQPNFTTYGILLRYYYPLSNDIMPLLQLGCGGNNAGQVYRAMLGIEYRVFDKVGFIAGFEYSIMRYHHQDNNFLSNKYGFNYGVSLNLK